MKRREGIPRESVGPPPCFVVGRFAARIAAAVSGLPVLDVACGSGRNAFPFQQLGCKVICVDKDLSLLDRSWLQPSDNPGLLETLQLDLIADKWPFGHSSVGAIINIHLHCQALFPFFADSLIPGGYLAFETVPGCGGNYLQLPRKNHVRAALADDFDLELYQEKRVGPSLADAVTVKLLAKRKL